MSSLYERLNRFLDKRDIDDASQVICIVHGRQAPCQRRDDSCQYSDDPVTVAEICGEE